MKIIYHHKNKILTTELTENERKQRYFYRYFNLYVVKRSEVKGNTQNIYLERIGG